MILNIPNCYAREFYCFSRKIKLSSTINFAHRNIRNCSFGYDWLQSLHLRLFYYCRCSYIIMFCFTIWKPVTKYSAFATILQDFFDNRRNSKIFIKQMWINNKLMPMLRHLNKVLWNVIIRSKIPNLTHSLNISSF